MERDVYLKLLGKSVAFVMQDGRVNLVKVTGLTPTVIRGKDDEGFPTQVSKKDIEDYYIPGR